MVKEKNGINSGFLIILVFLGLMSAYGCQDNTVQTNPQVVAGLLATWELRQQSGSQADVCAGELLLFGSNGIASAQCPGFEIVTTPYSAVDSTITFTDNGLQYNFQITNDDTTLIMTGINVDAVLTYGLYTF